MEGISSACIYVHKTRHAAVYFYYHKPEGRKRLACIFDWVNESVDLGPTPHEVCG